MKRKIRKDLQVVEITSDEEGFTDEELTALEEESVTPLPEWFAEEPFLIVVEKKK